MATQKEVQELLNLMKCNKPYHVFEEMRQIDHGVLGVMKVLYDERKEVISKDICRELGISSARVAVLIKKMEAKGLIVKKTYENDARISIISLTEKGEKLAKNMRSQMFVVAEKIVDEFGLERLKEMFGDMEKLKSIMRENISFLQEVDND